MGIMQAINSMLVSESVAHLRRADEASHAMASNWPTGAASIRSWQSWPESLTRRWSSMVSGVTLGSAGPAGDGRQQPGLRRPGRPEEARALTARYQHRRSGPRCSSARLVINFPPHGDVNLARIAGGRG